MKTKWVDEKQTWFAVYKNFKAEENKIVYFELVSFIKFSFVKNDDCLSYHEK